MRFTIQRPNFGKTFAQIKKYTERAVTSGMRDAADGLKQDLREDVVAAGLEERLSWTWRGKTFPEVGESAGAAAYFWSRAPKIVDAFDRSVVIHSEPMFKRDRRVAPEADARTERKNKKREEPRSPEHERRADEYHSIIHQIVQPPSPLDRHRGLVLGAADGGRRFGIGAPISAPPCPSPNTTPTPQTNPTDGRQRPCP